MSWNALSTAPWLTANSQLHSLLDQHILSVLGIMYVNVRLFCKYMIKSIICCGTALSNEGWQELLSKGASIEFGRLSE